MGTKYKCLLLCEEITEISREQTKQSKMRNGLRDVQMQFKITETSVHKRNKLRLLKMKKKDTERQVKNVSMILWRSS